MLAVGCGTGSPQSAPPPTGPPTGSFTGSTPTAVATQPPTSTSSAAPTAGSTPAAGSKDFGYVVGLESRTPLLVRFDRAEFLTGAAADKAAAEHGQESPVPNDYFIVNDNPRLRVLRVSDRCVVRGSLQLTGFLDEGHASVDLEVVPLADWVRFVGTPAGRRTPFHLTYGADGLVTGIDEQYVP